MDKSDSSYNNNLRRWFHFLTIGSLGLAYGLTPIAWGIILPYLSIVAASVIALDLMRIEIAPLNKFVQEKFKFILRKHEFHSVSGTSWFLISALISVAVFPKMVSALGFLYLAVGDPLAAYVGIRWGGKQIGQKTWAGCFGFLVSCWIVGTVWLVSQGILFHPALAVAGVSALIAAMAESLLHEMDDNLVIPLVSSGIAIALLA